MNKLLINFCNFKIVFEESVTLSKNDYFIGSLLFDIDKLISVTNYDGTITYDINEFSFSNNTIIYKGKDILYLSDNEYEGIEGDPFDLSEMQRFRIKRPYYSEVMPQKKQLLVTYEAKNTTDYFSIFDNNLLNDIKNKIANKKDIKIVVYGDSICRGMTSSGYLKREPFIPPWYELVKIGLEEKFGINVNIYNDSEIGMDALWGVNHMKERVPLDADLYIIGFGMNDGTGGVSEEFYINNIKEIIKYIGDKDTVLLSTIIPNPDAELLDGTKFLNKQEKYYPFLKSLENNHICVANFTEFHKNILVKKKYFDISGNNINHPNDFLGRCMAIGILRMLGIKE